MKLNPDQKMLRCPWKKTRLETNAIHLRLRNEQIVVIIYHFNSAKKPPLLK